jgi:diguanylate cyclase (GGDEF)-like protein
VVIADVGGCHGTDNRPVRLLLIVRPSAYGRAALGGERDRGRVVAVAPSEASADARQLVATLRWASLVSAGAAAMVAIVALIGWAVAAEALKGVLPGLPPMKANAAVGYLLASVSLVACVRGVPRSALRRAGAVCSALALLVGAATLAEYAFGVGLGIDQLLFSDQPGRHVPYPGRPAANAALGLMLLGLGLLLWDVRVGRWWPSNSLGWIAGTIGLLALIGYAAGIGGPLVDFSAHQQIALNSTVALALLSLGLLLGRSDRGELAMLSSVGPGGMVLRRLLPIAIVVPLALASLTLEGHRLGWFSTAVGGWLFACATTMAFAALGWVIASTAERAGVERDRALRELAAEARLESALREVATAAAREVDEQELSGLVAARLAELLDAAAVAVLRCEVQCLRVIGSGGPAHFPDCVRWDEESASVRAARTGRPARLEGDAPSHGSAGAFVASNGMRCGISVPVRTQGRVWGCISATTARAGGFTSEHETWLERFASLTSAALANAEAQARLREEARVESVLREVAAASASGTMSERALGQLVTDQVAGLLGVAASAVWRFDEEWVTVLGYHGSAQIPDRVPIGEASIVDRLRVVGGPVRIEDFAALEGQYASQVAESDRVRCAVGVPIIVEGAAWGGLTVGSTEAEPDLEVEGVLGRFAELVSAALANAQARERLRFRGRLEQALREVASASVSADVDERALAGLVAERIADLLDAPVASVVRFAGGDMTVLGSGGEAGLPVGMRIDQRSTVGQVARTQETVVVEDYHGFAPEYDELRRASGGRGVVAVPVFASGGLWGSLTVMLRPDAVASVAVELLERLAQLISAALANAHAQAQLREDARLERAMRTVASAGAQGNLDEPGLADFAAARIAELLDSPLAAVMRFDGAAGNTVLGHSGPFPFPAALAAEDHATVTAMVAETGKAARIDDYAAVHGQFAQLALAHGIGGAIAVPVRLDGVLWGCLASMTSRQGGFEPATERLLERFADVVSVALANVRSLRALRHEAKLEQALREVSSASASGDLDARDLFGLVAARVAELFDAPAAMVLRGEGAASVPVGSHGLHDLPDILPLGDTAAATVALRTGRSARVDDYADAQGGTRGAETGYPWGYRTALAAPVRLLGRPWGALVVAKPQPYSFPPHAESMLERFAALVTLALAQAETLATLQKQATTDGLTGLQNHRAFQQRLRTEFDRATRHNRPLSLVMFDLDAFKLINDLHGHDAGDRVLQAIGQTLRREQRASDVPARVGGDEFALIAPETTAEDALALAERLRAAAAAAAAEQLGQPVTLSAGVTDLNTATTMHDLFHLADSALYHAKHHGRNRAVRYTPGTEHDPATPPPSDHRRELPGLSALVRAVDARDSPTHRHAQRVAAIATELAIRYGWSAERCARLREAGLLHDVGKLGVPDTILTKSGALNDEEYEHVKRHADLGAQIADGILDHEQVSWVRGHHERPDGHGYPDALTHPRIPDGALMLAVADAYDTMTSGRAYKPGMAPHDAIAEMRRHAGTQFDADLLDLLEQWIIETPDRAPESAPGARILRTP